MPTIRRFNRAENQAVRPVLKAEAVVRARILGDAYETTLEAIYDFYNHEGGAKMTPAEVIWDSKDDRDRLLADEAEELARVPSEG